VGAIVQESFDLYNHYTQTHSLVTPGDEQRRDRQLSVIPLHPRLARSRCGSQLAEAKPGDIEATSTPHWAYLRTGASDHAAVRPFEIDAGEAQCLLEAALIRYLVVDNLEYEYTRRYAAAVVRALPERWHPVYASPDMTSRVYRRVGSADAIPTGRTGDAASRSQLTLRRARALTLFEA